MRNRLLSIWLSGQGLMAGLVITPAALAASLALIMLCVPGLGLMTAPAFAETSETAAAGESGEAAGVMDVMQLVPESAAGVFVIEDAPAFIEQWQASPMAKLWRDPQVQSFFEPLRQSLEIDQWNEKAKEETGYELDELIAMLDGGLVIYLEDVGAMLDALDAAETDEEIDEIEAPLFVLAKVEGDGSDLRDLLLRKAEETEDDQADEGNDVELVTEEFREVEYYLSRTYPEEGEPKDDYAWTIVDGFFAMTASPSRIEEVIADVLDGGAESSVQSSAVYQSVERVVTPGSLMMYWNLEQVFPTVRQLVEAAAEEAMEEGEEASQLPFSPNVVLDALGLDVLQAGFFSMDLAGGTVALDLGLTYSDDAGILQLLAYGGEVNRSSLVPDDAIAFGSASFDFKQAWSAVETVVNAVNPGILQMAAMQMSMAFQNAGVEIDLRQDVLENLGQELVVVQVEPAATAPEDEEALTIDASQVVAFSINQRQGFEMAIESLKAMAGQGSELFGEREYLGTTIYSLNTPAEAGMQQVSYAMTDTWLLVGIGATDALESVLIEAGDPGASAWERPDVKAALAVLPAGASGLGFEDVAVTGPRVFKMLAMMGAVDEELELVDPSAMPDDDVFGKYFGPAVNGIYKDNNSFVMRSRMLEPTEADAP